MSQTTRPRTTNEVLDALAVAVEVLRERHRRNADPDLEVAIKYLTGLIAYKRGDQD